MTFVQVPQAREVTGKAAEINVWERFQTTRPLHERVSSEDSAAQLSHEVKSSTMEVQLKLLTELHGSEGTFHITILVSASLAMKADLNIPWNKPRIMRRYRATHNCLL